MATLAEQLVVETKAAIYTRGLALATTLGLTVTSWAAGDTTRSLYHFVSSVLETLEINVAGYVSSGFLDHAEGDWLTLLAKQVFNVDRIEGTFATSTVELTNSGGAVFDIDAGDLTAKSTTSSKTYTNTEAGALAATGDAAGGDVLELEFTADVIGSDSSAAVDEIDALVTTLLGVTVTASTVAVGLDSESDESLRDRCRAKLATLSAAGPRDAYNFVVRDTTLTEVTDITRSRTVGDSATGDVTIYVASAAGPVAGASVTAAQDVVEEWAAPVCITPTVANCTAVTVNVTYSVWIYESVGETDATIEETIEAALEELFASRPIGGDIISPATTGKLYQSLIAATIRGVYPDHTFRVTVSAPAGDTSLAISEVAVLGTVGATISQEADV
jgi:phage-related baseplate assembly protein